MADPQAVPGAAAPPEGRELADWITGSTRCGRTIVSAIPATYARYATIVIPDDDPARTRADEALVEVLQAHTPAQPWWLGYLQTGAGDDMAFDVPRVALYAEWPYVLLEAGPEQVLTARNGYVTPSGTAVPELVLPQDRSWLVSTLWDDDWRCVGGPAALVDGLLLRPELEVRTVTLDEDATPPGRTSC